MTTPEIKIIFAVIAVVAIVVNSLTVTLLLLQKTAWLKRTHCRLILALAIQDVLTGICLLVVPSFVLDEHAYPLPSSPNAKVIFCSVIWSQYIPFALGVTSVYTCVMLALDRWLAVVRPLYFKTSQSSRAVSAALLITPWLFGFGIGYTSLIHAEPIKLNSTYRCSWKEVENLSTRTWSATFSFLVDMLIPAAVIGLAYIHIVFHLRKLRSRVSTASNASSTATGLRTLKGIKRITYTVIVASTVVVICWFPDQLYYALSQVGLADLNTVPHAVVKILAFANSCVNPFIYSFSNRDYRNGFKEFLWRKPPAKNNNRNSKLGLSTRTRANVTHMAGQLHINSEAVVIWADSGY